MRAVNFQDPAAQMKRAMFQAVAIGVVAVVLYMFCVEPSQTALQKAKTDLSGLQDKQAQMVRDLKGAGLVKERLEVIKSQRQDYLNGLLHPMLESYAMRAKSLLDPLAEDVGLSVSDYAELPVRRLPLPKPQSPRAEPCFMLRLQGCPVSLKLSLIAQAMPSAQPERPIPATPTVAPSGMSLAAS